MKSINLSIKLITLFLQRSSQIEEEKTTERFTPRIPWRQLPSIKCLEMIVMEQRAIFCLTKFFFINKFF